MNPLDDILAPQPTLSYMPPGTQPGATPGIQAAPDEGQAELERLLASLQMQQPVAPRQPGVGRSILGVIGDALTAAGRVRAGGMPPEIGTFLAGLQGRRAAYDQQAAQATAYNRDMLNRLRIGQYEAGQTHKNQLERDRLRAAAEKEIAMLRVGEKKADNGIDEVLNRSAIEKYPQAGVASMDTPDQVREKIKPFVLAENAHKAAMDESLLSGREDTAQERQANIAFTAKWPQRQQGLIDEIHSAKATAQKLKIAGLPEDLDAKAQQLDDAVRAAMENPSVAARSNVDKVIADIHRVTATVRGKAGVLDRINTEDRNNIVQMGVMDGMVDQALAELETQGDIGGPIAGSGIGRVFTAVTSGVGNQANYLRQTKMNALLQDIASTIANMKGGKAITATEIKLFGATLPRLNDTYQQKLAALKQLKSRIELARGKMGKVYAGLSPQLLEAISRGETGEATPEGFAPSGVEIP